MARAQVLLVMDFNGGGVQQPTVHRICRLPVIGSMFELLRLILLTIISYAFSLFRCESMGTGDFAGYNPGTAIPTSDPRRDLRGLRSSRHQDLALSTGSAAAGGLAGLDDHDNLVVETPLTLGHRVVATKTSHDQRRVEFPAVHERPVTLPRVRAGVVSSVPVLRRVDIGTEVSRSRGQGHQTARHRFSRY